MDPIAWKTISFAPEPVIGPIRALGLFVRKDNDGVEQGQGDEEGHGSFAEWVETHSLHVNSPWAGSEGGELRATLGLSAARSTEGISGPKIPDPGGRGGREEDVASLIAT